MAIVLLLSGLVVMPAAWFLVPFAVRRRDEAWLRALCRNKRALVLSYDDGPSEVLLPRLLALLKARSARASFFLLGRNVAGRGAMLDQLIADGHELGSHTFDHFNAWKTPPGKAARDLAAGREVLVRNGIKSSLFRAPYGKTTLATLWQCWRQGQRLAWWTVDDQDTWDRRSVEDVVTEVIRNGGGVVLMHDLDMDDRGAKLPHAEYILDLTARLIDAAELHSLRITHLADLYDAKR